MRFFWKHESVSAGTQAGKAKILRKVQFPKVLDIYEFCSDELKHSLDHGREFDRKERETEDKRRLAGLEAQERELAAQRHGQDVEMKDEEEEKKEVKRIVGKAGKAAEKTRLLKKEDERLYR